MTFSALKPLDERSPRRRRGTLATLGILFGGLVLPAPGAAPADTNAAPVVISLKLSRGRIVVPVRVNGSAPLSFLLDTGFSMTMISPEQADTLQLQRSGEVTIAGIAGDERASVFGGATFDFSGATYAPSRVAALPSEGRRRAHDGILGSGFFRRFVVEIDARARTLKLHEPKSFAYAGAGEILPLTFRRTTPIVQATIRTPGGADVRGGFEIDTGCDGLCLGREFVEAHQLAPGGARSDTKRGVGGEAKVRTGHLPHLQLGKLTIEKPEADFFLDGSPADKGLAGHIGMEILRRYRIIFDYSRHQMILESYPAEAAPKR